MIISRSGKAYCKVGQEWKEVGFIWACMDFKEEEVKHSLSEPLNFSGKATIRFAVEVESISKTLRMKPQIEKWKSSGKRKMPRIK